MELMRYRPEIEHEGVVSTADEQSVTVLLSRATACSGCHSEKLCGISGKQEKIVTINGKYGVSPGDHVIVTMKRSLGYSALLLGYVLPLSVVLLLLIILTALSVNELSSGLFSIGALVPYYAILFLYRKYLDKKFFFIIKS
jgi:sigma-E factor negative regulatory protein RseC